MGVVGLADARDTIGTELERSDGGVDLDGSGHLLCTLIADVVAGHIKRCERAVEPLQAASNLTRDKGPCRAEVGHEPLVCGAMRVHMHMHMHARVHELACVGSLPCKRPM